jgi:predicted regulator of Ras-like GTPase activity (Roadblock/LC7/MglB family)
VDAVADLELMVRLPDVKSAVLGDLAGIYLDGFQEPDGEAVAAVVGVVASTLLQAGEQLGLGALRSVSVSAPSRARIILVLAGSVLTATIEPARALGAVEKALEAVDE